MGAITRQRLTWTLCLFILLLLLFWGHSVWAPLSTPTKGGDDMPLGELIHRMTLAWPLSTTLLTALVVFVNSVILLRIVSRNMILTDRSYLPIIIYLLISAGGYFGNATLGAFTVSFLMICSFDLMLTSFRRVVQYGVLFNSALLIGIGLLIWSHTVAYIPLILVALILFNKGGREWIVAGVGLLLPLAICSYIYWGMGYSFLYVPIQLGEDLVDGVTLESTVDWLKYPEWLIFAGVCAIASLLSIISFWQRAATMRTRAYKSYLYTLWNLLFAAFPLLTPGRAVGDFALIAAPLAIIIPSYFIRYNGWIPNLIYILLLGSVIFYNLRPLLGL